MKKKFLLIALCAVAMGAAGLTACNSKAPVVEEATTFKLEVRRFNGTDSSYNAKIDGELLASKTIDVAVGQVTVSDALNVIAPLTDGVHKVMLNDTDYLSFTETTVSYSTSWFLSGGYMAAEPNYVAGDYEWSYMAYNGHYSNGVTIDFLDGLNTYTVVIDGYDGNIGTSPTY